MSGEIRKSQRDVRTRRRVTPSPRGSTRHCSEPFIWPDAVNVSAQERMEACPVKRITFIGSLVTHKHQAQGKGRVLDSILLITSNLPTWFVSWINDSNHLAISWVMEPVAMPSVRLGDSHLLHSFHISHTAKEGPRCSSACVPAWP